MRLKRYLVACYDEYQDCLMYLVDFGAPILSRNKEDAKRFTLGQALRLCDQGYNFIEVLAY